jgi:hypothetical protein
LRELDPEARAQLLDVRQLDAQQRHRLQRAGGAQRPGVDAFEADVASQAFTTRVISEDYLLLPADDN